MNTNPTKQMSAEEKKAFLERQQMETNARMQREALMGEAASLEAVWKVQHYRRQLNMESQHLAEKIREAVEIVFQELGPFTDAQKEKALNALGFVKSEEVQEESKSETKE